MMSIVRLSRYLLLAFLLVGVFSTSVGEPEQELSREHVQPSEAQVSLYVNEYNYVGIWQLVNC